MKLRLAFGVLVIFSMLTLATLRGAADHAGVEATGPGGQAPAQLVGTVDPRNLRGSPRAMVSKRFFHPGGDAALAAAKARVANITPGSGISPRGRSSLTSNPVPGVGFEGISFNETYCQCLPPDGAIAAGPNHLVGAVNTAYKVWSKSGQVLLGATDMGLFFLGCN